MKEIDATLAMDASYNCAQSVLLPYLKIFKMPEDNGLKIASVFGGGMGRMQETCGAVTGAFMVLGLQYGFIDPKDQTQRDTLLEKTKEFVKKFKNEFGTITCRELLMCNFNTEEGMKKHKEENQRELVCKKCVNYSVKTLEEMLAK